MADINERYNTKCPGVKRLMREAIELAEATEEYCARPLEDNLFDWHFTVRGPPATDFEGGVYHGRIQLPKEYPMVPPNIILYTPNGRFETHKKICLSISGHHPETWQPSWSIRTVLLALIAFMPTPSENSIASLEYTPTERRRLAAKSRTWACPDCGVAALLLSTKAAEPPSDEERSAIAHMELAGEPEPSAAGSLPAPAPPPADLPLPEYPLDPATNNFLDQLTEMIIVLLAIAVAVFIYRRWHWLMFSDRDV